MKGQVANPKGRKPRAAETDYLAAIKSACSTDDFVAITKRAVEQAKRGDKYAREWLSKQFGTEAAQKIYLESIATQIHVVARTEDVSRILADPEATAKLLDMVQGQPKTIDVAVVETPKNGNGHA